MRRCDCGSAKGGAAAERPRGGVSGLNALHTFCMYRNVTFSGRGKGYRLMVLQ